MEVQDKLQILRLIEDVRKSLRQMEKTLDKIEEKKAEHYSAFYVQKEYRKV